MSPENESFELNTDHTNRALVGYFVILLLICVLMGFYCSMLNRQLYQHQSPFFDSVSYHQKMYRVMLKTQEVGLLSGLSAACFDSTTVCLPFVLAALLALVCEPDRLVGVWIQVGYLFIFLSSFFYLAVSVKGLKPRTGVFACLAFLCAGCLFYENGGMSDFRMDMILCLMFGTTAMCYLIAMSKPTWWHFVLLGIAGGACCLSRGTAPVYLLITFGPLVFVELILTAAQRRKKMVGVCLAGAIAAASSLWFYLLNYEYLHFYYCVWNTDANAKLSLWESMGHLKMVRRSIGSPLMLLAVTWFVCLTHYWRVQPEEGEEDRGSNLAVGWGRLGWRALEAMKSPSVDLRLLWIGVCPLAMLIGRGAGMNPFVSMPAVIGLIAFVVLPLLHQQERVERKWVAQVFQVSLLICFALAAVRGFDRHNQFAFNQMEAHQAILDNIISDSLERDFKKVKFGTTHISETFTESLMAAMIFDRAGCKPGVGHGVVDGVRFQGIWTFNKPAVANWERVPGDSDQKKLDHLYEEATVIADYLVVPDGPSAKWLEKNRGHNIINLYQTALRERIRSHWTRVGARIQTSDHEHVEIYRR